MRGRVVRAGAVIRGWDAASRPSRRRTLRRRPLARTAARLGSSESLLAFPMGYLGNSGSAGRGTGVFGFSPVPQAAETINRGRREGGRRCPQRRCATEPERTAFDTKDRRCNPDRVLDPLWGKRVPPQVTFRNGGAGYTPASWALLHGGREARPTIESIAIAIAAWRV